MQIINNLLVRHFFWLDVIYSPLFKQFSVLAGSWHKHNCSIELDCWQLVK